MSCDMCREIRFVLRALETLLVAAPAILHWGLCTGTCNVMTINVDLLQALVGVNNHVVETRLF